MSNETIDNPPDKVRDNLAGEILRKVDISRGISETILYRYKESNPPSGVTYYDMFNTSNGAGKTGFLTKLKQFLQYNSINYTLDNKINDNILEFISKMKVGFVVKSVKPVGDYSTLVNVVYRIELHDTIGRFIMSESSGPRCRALNLFYNVMNWVVGYINDNCYSGDLKNGNKEAGPDFDTKIFNFPADFGNTGSGIKESYKACNGGIPMGIGGSKSRRIRRRKHSRKTHHKHARKTHHKRTSKSHKRAHRSRAARKHKKHTRR